MEVIVEACLVALSCRQSNGTASECIEEIESVVPFQSEYLAEWVYWASIVEQFKCDHFRTKALWPVAFCVVTITILVAVIIIYVLHFRSTNINRIAEKVAALQIAAEENRREGRWEKAAKAIIANSPTFEPFDDVT